VAEGKALAAVFIAVGVIGTAYGLLELLLPSVAIRWQIRSTSRTRGPNRAIGEWFQQRYRMDPIGSADTDLGVRRRVRWTGLLLVVFGVGCLAAGIQVWD
jgi:hypothetical protein